MKKTYEVTAATGYAGHRLGDTFEAELDELSEKRALKRGSIKQVTSKRKEKSGE